MSLDGKVVLLTGASMGIGEAIAHALAAEGAQLVLLARSEDKLKQLCETLAAKHPACKAGFHAVDVGDHAAVDGAVAAAVRDRGRIDVLINNAGLALGAPARFPELRLGDVARMNDTNVNGVMFVTHAVLNRAMLSNAGNGGRGTILNVTSTTALEAPPFPGEAVYHANKALQEAFTNALRNELAGTDIRVLALRPGVVATHFHRQRVGFDAGLYRDFMDGFEPLLAEDVASAAVFMLTQPLNRSIKALDVVPSAQRSLNVFDRTWNERHPQQQS